MKTILKNNKRKFIAFFILISIVSFYKAVNAVIAVKNLAEKEYEVYAREISEIPVLKKRLKNSTALADEINSFDIKNITAKSIYIEDIDTGTKLFEKNPERLLLPASTTKIMTALVVMDNHQLDDVVTVPDVSQVEGYRVGLFAGEKIKVRNLLKAALIESSNDAAYTLAYSIDGGVDLFVTLMNKKAQDLSLKSTSFENPVGFDDPKQKSSAHDLAILTKELIKNNFFKKVVSTKEEVITDVSGLHKHHLYSTNKLLGVDKSVIGVKTGTTGGAGQVLITEFNRQNRNILIIIMGSEDRYKETSQLIDWVFDNYIWLTPKQIIEKN